MRTAITTELLRRLPPGPCDVRDTKVTNFVLRVRPSGRHSYLVSLGRGQWYTLGSTQTLKPDEARQLARAMLADRDKGADPIAKRRASRRASLTLTRFLEDHYAPWVVAHRKSGEKTLARLSGVLGPEFGAIPINELTTWALEKWRTKRLTSGRSSGTVNRDIGCLKAALNRAVAWQLIPAHALGEIKPLSEDKIGRLRYLTDAEDERLRAALSARDDQRRAERKQANTWRRDRGYDEWPDYGPFTDHLSPIVALALHTGLRFGELADLRWADVSLEQALLTVRTEAAKSGRARYVPLNTEATATLGAWRSETAGRKAYVFPGRDGGRLADIKTAWAPLLRRAQITGFRFHDLRHTFASRLVMAGVDLNTVRELLGHADLKMTLRYAHLAPEHKAAAVAKLVR